MVALTLKVSPPKSKMRRLRSLTTFLSRPCDSSHGGFVNDLEDIPFRVVEVGGDSLRKKGVGPRETQVALGVSRDSKDLKDH